MTDFVHLHVHSEYSLLDSLCRLEALVQQAAALGQRALAITDHATLFGVIPFTRLCQEAGIHPVIGCEFYVAPGHRSSRESREQPWHLTLLAENQQGYQNLVRLSSRAHLEGWLHVPRIDWELLSAHHEGLICLSGCPRGEVPGLLSAGRTAEARAAAVRHAELFGPGNYYIELMDHGLPEDGRRVQGLLALARELGLPTVVSNDVHYLQPTDAAAHDVLLAIGANRPVSDPERLRFPTGEYFLKSGEQMARRFGHLPAALAATVAIAERCQVGFTFGKPRLPRFDVPGGVPADAHLRQAAQAGLLRRNPTLGSEQERRLAHELDVIVGMGFADYFLIVADFVAYARKSGIAVGPGRGSGAGSLVAYCLGITDVDPLEHDLIFERFLNPERVDMPDFDIDFCYERRGEVIDYVVRKYGKDHVAQIITFNTLAARAAIRDVGRVLESPPAVVDRLAKLVPSSSFTLEKARAESAGLARMLTEEPAAERLYTIAQQLEGLPRNPSVHAAGVVITATPLVENVPLYHAEGGSVTTQFEMGTLADLGLLKMDFLGLRNLTVINQTVQVIQRFQPGFTLQPATSDPETFAMLSRGETLGVFQLEADWVAQTLREIKPTAWEDITATISLCRPGPMENIPTYVAARFGTAHLPHPDLAPVLGKTHGVMVYQEQVLQVASLLAGFRLGEADLLRRAVAKKKARELASYEERFLSGCVGRGYAAELASAMWALILKFAGYGFNKSHAAAYAKVALETAYLKRHWPIPYMAALMTSVIGSSLLPRYLAECRRLGITVAGPDVNASYPGFSPTGVLTPARAGSPGGGSIRFGLAAIKNVGEGAVHALIQARERAGAFTSLRDLLGKVESRHLPRKALESLIKAGALDGLGERAALLAELDAQSDSARRGAGQLSLLDAPQLQVAPAVPPATPAERLAMEAEALGFYLSGHPMEPFGPQLQGRISEIAALAGKREGERVVVAGLVSAIKPVRTKNGQRMAFVTLEDMTAALEVVVFPRLLGELRPLLEPQRLLAARGRLAQEEDGVRLLADDLQPLEQALATWAAQPRPPQRRSPAPAAPPPQQQVLYLRLEAKGEHDPALVRLLALLEEMPGPVPVRLKLLPSGRWIGLHERYRITPQQSFLTKLADLLGHDAVILR